MLIAIVNQSTVVTDADVQTMTDAIALQVQNDVAPLWERVPAQVVFVASTAIPQGAHGIAIVDNIQNQPTGVLGLHTTDPAGQVWGVVAAQPELTNGKQVLTGDWSVSSTLSHEVLEMFIDPTCNLWANNGKGSVYSLEICDPVEAPTYTVNVDGQDVSVSNFVTPAWFDPQAPSGSQFDKMGQFYQTGQPPPGPFTVLPGGYTTYESAARKPQQQWGSAYPNWRKLTKTTAAWSRSQQRVIQVQAEWHM